MVWDELDAELDIQTEKERRKPGKSDKLSKTWIGIQSGNRFNGNICRFKSS